MTQATLNPPPSTDADDANATASLRNRRIRLTVAFAALVAVLVWFMPALLARTSVRHQFVHLVFPGYAGKATIDRASLNWFSPVELYGVHLDDVDGHELAHAERLTSSRSLAGLLFGSSSDLGTFTLDTPQVLVSIRPGGSNLEDAVRPIFESEEESDGSGWTLVINDGEIRWTKADGQPSSNACEAISGTIVQSPGDAFPGRIELSARLSDGERHGDVNVQLAPVAQGTPEGVVKTKDLPLIALQPWLDRFESGLQAAGTLSTDLVGRSSKSESGSWTITGAIDGRLLRLTMSAAGQSPLILESMTVRLDALADDDGVTFRTAKLQCDVATASLSGEIHYADLFQADSSLQAALSLLDRPFEMTADVDLAKLMKLPLSVDGVPAVTSGRAKLKARSFAEGKDHVGTFRVECDDLVAGTADKPIVWRDPFAFEAQVRRTDSEWKFDRVAAEADFLSISGSGSPSDAELTFEADLDKLRQRLSQFIALPDGVLAGRASGRLHAKRTGTAGEVAVEAGAEFRDLALQLAGRRWTEKELTARLNGRGTVAGTALEEIATAHLNLHSVEGDEFSVDLSKPVSLSSAGPWPLKVAARGEIARWLNRFRIWGLVDGNGGWNAGGTLDAAAKVDAGSASVTVSDLVVDAQNLKLQVGGGHVDEARVRLTGSAVWNSESQTLTLPKAGLISETATIDASRLVLPIRGDQPASGDIAFRAGIGRVARYVMSDRPSVWLSGVAAGTVALRHKAATTEFETTIDLERPTLSRPATDPSGRTGWSPVWSDEKSNVVMKGRFDHNHERLSLASCRAAGSGFAIEITGDVDRPAGDAVADLSGTFSYELETLVKRITAGLPDGVSATGRGSRPIAIRGPLFSAAAVVDPKLTAKAGINWTSLELWGVKVEAGELGLGLNRQVLATAPFDWSAAGGRVRGKSAVTLSDRPTLTVAKGRLVDTIVLTPEISRQWLQFAAPALAESTVVEGSVSFDVESCRVPLESPQSAQAQGVLVVHQATASPGPFAESLLGVLNQIRTLSGSGAAEERNLRLIAPRQNVTVRVADGRVFHDRFTIRIGGDDGPVIATSGSVGFDQSLDLVASIPLDAKWFKNERVAAMFGSQTLQVPIRGTLSRPVPEPRVLQDLGRKAATDAVGGFLEKGIDQELGDPLRKLFDRE